MKSLGKKGREEESPAVSGPPQILPRKKSSKENMVPAHQQSWTGDSGRYRDRHASQFCYNVTWRCESPENQQLFLLKEKKDSFTRVPEFGAQSQEKAGRGTIHRGPGVWPSRLPVRGKQHWRGPCGPHGQQRGHRAGGGTWTSLCRWRKAMLWLTGWERKMGGN